MQALSSQVLSLRAPSLQSGTVRKHRCTDTPADIFTLRAYQKSFSGVAKEDLNAILEGSCYNRGVDFFNAHGSAFFFFFLEYSSISAKSFKNRPFH